MARQKVTHEEIYHGYQVQQRADGLITQILDGFENRLDYLSQQQGVRQLSAAHLDVTVPDSTGCNDTLGTLVGQSLHELRQELERQGIESQAGWVREVSSNRSDGKSHIHIGFIWESEQIQSGWTIAEKLNEKLIRKTGLPDKSAIVHVNPPKAGDQQTGSNSKRYNAIKLRVHAPGAAEQRANILNRFSYLAKATGKGQGAKGLKDYGFSQCKE